MNRPVWTAVAAALVFCSLQCAQFESSPAWQGVKITDLGPPNAAQEQSGRLETANFDLFIYELPADDFAKLADLWESLNTGGIKYYSYRAFEANLFRAALGRRFTWSGTLDMLAAAGGRRMAKISLLLPPAQPQDVTITGLDQPRKLAYVSRDLTRQSGPLGPGVMVLRLTAQKVPGVRGLAQLTAYPALTRPVVPPVEPLAEQAKQQQTEFKGAGLGLKMGPDDYLVLGPRKYLSEQVTLPGLFFSNPAGTLFLARGRHPQLEPAFRVFVLVCTTVNY